MNVGVGVKYRLDTEKTGKSRFFIEQRQVMECRAHTHIYLSVRSAHSIYMAHNTGGQKMPNRMDMGMSLSITTR